MRMVIIAESRAAADAVRQGLRFAPGMTVVGYADGRTRAPRPSRSPRRTSSSSGTSATPPRRCSASSSCAASCRTAKLVLFTADMAPRPAMHATVAGMDAAVATSVGATGLGPLLRQIAAGAVYHVFTPAEPRRRGRRVARAPHRA